ncbi:hypothetical protein A6S26_32305 [Nostoc sp. ATCC 43529]|nr:hypothetical protein A6S26_32305 [Nostoc sp. ATCC 43529]
MQKLVTIYLDRESYRSMRRGPSESHGAVEEHLGDFISAGWQIKSIAAGGGGGIASGGGLAAGGIAGLGCCWVIVLLEKP